MINIETIILIIYPLGAWLSLPLLPWHVTLLDVLVLLFVVKNGRIFFGKEFVPLWLFSAALIFSYIRSLWQVDFNFTWRAFLYLGRTVVYYAFLAYFLNKRNNSYKSGIFWVTWWLMIIGLSQYLLVRNFLSWQVLGWDPHIDRLVGNWYDPGFLATAYLLLLIFWNSFLNSFATFGLWLITWLALFLTYARSIWILAAGWLLSRRKHIALYLLVLLGGTFLIFPHNTSEGTKILRTASINGRWRNGKVAWQIFKHHPLLGIGFDNLASWRLRQGINVGHASMGFENSFLFLLATGGLISCFGYFIFLWNLMKRMTLQGQHLTILWLLSGLFNNTLFYPLLITLLAFLLAATKDGR